MRMMICRLSHQKMRSRKMKMKTKLHMRFESRTTVSEQALSMIYRLFSTIVSIVLF